MKKIAITLCVLMSISAFSQTDFKKGFIINNQGEKINGYVNYKENSSIYEYCEFKSTLESEVKKYFPNLIKAYGFENDKFFLSKNISSEVNNSENKFLNVIISGIATLYRIGDTFYLEKDTIFKELNNELLVKNTQNLNVYRRPSKRYIGILKVFFKDCPEVKIKIEKINYNERDLEKLVNEYNKCRGQESIVYKKLKPKFRAEFGFFFGLSSLNINYKHDFLNPLFFTDKSSNTSSLFGGFTEIYMPRFSERVSFYTGVFFSENKLSESENNSKYGINTLEKVNTNLKRLKIPLGVRYTFPKKKITPFFTIGLSNYINFNSTTSWSSEKEIGNTAYTTIKNYKTNNTAFGYFISIGAKKKITKKLNFFVDLVYDNSLMTDKITTSVPIGSRDIGYQYSMSSLQLSIGVLF